MGRLSEYDEVELAVIVPREDGFAALSGNLKEPGQVDRVAAGAANWRLVSLWKDMVDNPIALYYDVPAGSSAVEAQ